MVRVPQLPGLVNEVVQPLQAHRGAFGQQRVYERVLALVMAAVRVSRSHSRRSLRLPGASAGVVVILRAVIGEKRRTVGAASDRRDSQP